MYDLKTVEEIEELIEMLMQETDASKRTKSKHQLKHQFRMALDRAGGLERTNKRLKEELESYPEYQQKQTMKVLGSYMNVLKGM